MNPRPRRRPTPSNVQPRAATPSKALVRRAAPRTIAEARGYDRDDLHVVAEIAHRYLFNGNPELAQVLFEGLVAVAPDEPYFALALGLTSDHLGEVRAAHHWYARAAQLDPGDGRPDVNRGELYLEAGDRDRARAYFARGRSKAERKDDQALVAKTTAILAYLGARA